MMVSEALSIASIFGPFLVVIGLWMLLFTENLTKVWTSLKATPCSFYQMSILNLLFGLFIVSHFNAWIWDKLLLVTLLGWFLVLRGLLALFVPQLFIKLTMKTPARAKRMGLIPLVWGLILCWVAFA
jgi:hypothetical protein